MWRVRCLHEWEGYLDQPRSPRIDRASDCLFLDGVWSAWNAPHLFRWAGRAGRWSSQGSQRSRPAANGHWLYVCAGIFLPAHFRGWLAGSAQQHARFQGPACAARPGWFGKPPDGGSGIPRPDGLPGVVGDPCGTHPAVPARFQPRPEHGFR